MFISAGYNNASVLRGGKQGIIIRLMPVRCAMCFDRKVDCGACLAAVFKCRVCRAKPTFSRF